MYDRVDQYEWQKPPDRDPSVPKPFKDVYDEEKHRRYVYLKRKEHEEMEGQSED
jgi:hypothetical protein